MEDINPALFEFLANLTEVLQGRDIYYGGDLCDDLRAALKAAFLPDGHGLEAGDGSLDPRGPASQVRALLMRRFSRVAVIDAESALSPGTGFNFVELLRIMASAIVEAMDLKLDARALHPEELTQLLKDEKSILFCFLSIQLLSRADFQRLRGLGFTQTDHRVLFCGRSDVLQENSSSLADAGDIRQLGRAVELGSESGRRHVFREKINPGPPPGRSASNNFSAGTQALLCTYATNSPEIVGHLFPLERPILRIGRRGDMDILVPEITVSGLHALLKWQNGSWLIEDVGSTNGTYWDWSYERQTKVRLIHGGEVQLAELRLKLVSFQPDSPHHQHARDYLTKHDGLTGLLSRSHLRHALDDEAAFAEWAVTTMTVACYELKSQKASETERPIILELLALRRAAAEAVDQTADLMASDFSPVAGRAGPRKFAISLVGQSLEDAHEVAEQVAGAVKVLLPEGMTLGVTLARLQPGRSGSSLID